MLGVFEQKHPVGSVSVHLNLATGLNCLRWSEDDKLAIITNEHLQVLVNISTFATNFMFPSLLF